MLDTQDTDQEIQDEPVLSIRDSLEAALKSQADEPERSAHEEGGDVEEKPSTPADRPRDEAGKFTKKPEDAPKEAAPGKESGEADKPADSVRTGAPSSWNAQGKALFEKADPSLRDYILKRETETHEGIAKLRSEYQGKADFAEAMWREIAPHKHLIDREGGTPVAAVRDLLGMAALMRTGTHEQKRQLLLSTARQFGVNLTDTQADPQGQPQPAYDPRVDTLEQTLRAMAAQNQEQTRQGLLTQVEDFAKSHPHFESVRVEMGRLIEAGIATDMKDAYERAIWLNPEVRQKVQSEMAEKTEREKQAKAKEQAEKARRASGSVTGAPGMAGKVNSQAPAPTLRAELERNLQAQRA